MLCVSSMGNGVQPVLLDCWTHMRVSIGWGQEEGGFQAGAGSSPGTSLTADRCQAGGAHGRLGLKHLLDCSH